MRFDQAVNSFLDIYKSIDVRIAAYKQDEQWKAGFTIIRFRRENKEELNGLQNQLWRDHEKIENEDFKLFLVAMDVSVWSNFRKNWLENKIVLPS